MSTNKTTIPKWLGKRVSFNLTSKHAVMLDDLVRRFKQDNPRETTTGVIGTAIERLHEMYDFSSSAPEHD